MKNFLTDIKPEQEIEQDEITRRLFAPTFSEEHELARRNGDTRFKSECPHERKVNGRCAQCWRKVI